MRLSYIYTMPSNLVRTANSPDPVQARVADYSWFAGKLPAVEKVRELYRRVRQSPQGFGLETILADMRIDLRADAAHYARIPAKGPVVVVANHPYGMLDGALLTVLLTRVRTDVKVLTNFIFSDVPELRQHCIFVDPFQADRSVESNRKAMREALRWLTEGGMLAVFPAGEVSHWQMPAAGIVDPEWNDTAVRLIRKTKATSLPIYFCGHNSVGFQLLSMIYPSLRSAFLLSEFLQQAGKTVEMRVGSAIPAESVCAIADDREAIEYLRSRTYLLARRRRAAKSWPQALRSRLVVKSQTPVAAAPQAEALTREIEGLPDGRRLAENSELAVYLAQADEIPNLLQEVGRLRELTFRGAGEGTGRSRDLDAFDEYYSHILLWNTKRQELIGGYRAGNTDEILKNKGMAGLYTSTLFRYDERLFEKLGPAIELGRSFIRPEYQRQYAPLLLLWKGIARLVALNPEIAVLFGAVSISNDYNEASREMIYRFFELHMHEDELSAWIEPRSPFRASVLRRWDCRSMCRALRDLEELSQPITDVEADGKGLPILLRQYAKIGGRLLGFNLDRKFSNVLDGLVVVDLRQTDPAVLDRYMGREAAARFRAAHSPVRR